MMADDNNDNHQYHGKLPNATESSSSSAVVAERHPIRSVTKRKRNRNNKSKATASTQSQTNKLDKPQQQQKKQQTPQSRRPHQTQGANHSVTKRPTAKLSQRPNDIYVSNKSDFRAQLKQCISLLGSSEFHEIFLHSIGAAISRAINLALTLVADSQGGLGYEANTSTIVLTDNLHPLHDDADFSISQRLNGCLHVRVYRHCRDVLLLDECAVKPTTESTASTGQ